MSLAGVEAPGRFAVVVGPRLRGPLRPAREPVCAVAPLEDLQAVAALALVPGAHLALAQHRLADPRPEVPGAAVALGAVG